MTDEEGLRVLREAQEVCASEGHGIEVSNVSALLHEASPNGVQTAHGFAVELSLPPMINPSDALVKELVPKLEAILGVSRVWVVLAAEE